jgi:hypothetical protein
MSQWTLIIPMGWIMSNEEGLLINRIVGAVLAALPDDDARARLVLDVVIERRFRPAVVVVPLMDVDLPPKRAVLLPVSA